MNNEPTIRDDERSVWERPRTISIIWRALIASCLTVLVLPYVLMQTHDWAHKPHFEGRERGIEVVLAHIADHVPVFYAMVGFVSFAFIVLVGQHLRYILMRREDYYQSGPDTADTDRVTVAHPSDGDGAS